MNNKKSRCNFLILFTISMMVLLIFPVVTNADVNVTSLNCSSYISNAEHADYMNNMMKYYINSNSNLQQTLDNGKSVVFCFEGGSDNYPSSGYSDLSSNIRNQAAVFVVRENMYGNAYIVFASENATSIPSHPTATTGGAYNGATTIIDGIYELQTTNHTGPYGALNVKADWSYYTPSNNLNGQFNYCSGINVHTRSSNNAGSVSGAWSEGCQVIGTGSYSTNEFNTFMKSVADINYDVWINYSAQEFNTIASGRSVGYYVVDRQLAKDGLLALYNNTALNNIISWSTKAKENALSLTELGTNFYAYIVNNNAWKHIGVSDSSDNVELREINGYSNEIWYFERQSDMSYKITNARNGKVLDVESAGGSGTNVWTYQSNDTTPQRWRITGTDQNCQLHPMHINGISLDVYGGSGEIGANLNVWETNSSGAQSFCIWKLDLKPCTLTYTKNGNEVTFSWDKKAYADNYNIRVYKDVLYSGEHFPAWGCNSCQGTMMLSPGHYYAYVDSTNAIATIQSNIVEFDIVEKPDKPIAKVDVQESKMTVTWKETANTTHYNIWINKKDDDGEYRAYGNQKQFVTSPYVQELPEGDYYVELQAYNSNGYENGDWLYTLSDHVYFTVSNKPSIAMDMAESSLRATATHTEQIIEHGIVCGPDSGVDLDSPGRIRITYTDFDSSNGYTYEVKENENYYFKAYAVWMEGTERKVIYSEEINPSAYVKEPVWGEWSDWTTTPVEANDHLQVRTKVEYSYSDKETTTSGQSTMDGWTQYGTPEISYSGWSGWGDAWQGGNDKEVQSRTVYRYHAYVCPNCGKYEEWRGGSDCGQYTLTDNNYRENWSTIPYAQSNYASPGSYTTKMKYTTSLGDGQRWFFTIDNVNDTAPGTQCVQTSLLIDKFPGGTVIKTQYNYRTKSYTYHYYRWSEWSEWSETEYVKDENRDVKQRTLYSYRSNS